MRHLLRVATMSMVGIAACTCAQVSKRIHDIAVQSYFLVRICMRVVTSANEHGKHLAMCIGCLVVSSSLASAQASHVNAELHFELYDQGKCLGSDLLALSEKSGDLWIREGACMYIAASHCKRRCWICSRARSDCH